MIPVIWSKSFPVKIISGIIKKGYYPSTYKTKQIVRYKSFSLPPHYRHYYRHYHRQITFYRFRKSPTFFFLIKFPNNFIRFSVFICNFAAKFKTHINFKQTCCKSYSVLTLLKTN